MQIHYTWSSHDLYISNKQSNEVVGLTGLLNASLKRHLHLFFHDRIDINAYNDQVKISPEKGRIKTLNTALTAKW